MLSLRLDSRWWHRDVWGEGPRGFLSFWSPPPPTSETFEVPSSGVGFLLRDHISARKLDIPELHEWISIGRLLAIRVIMPTGRLNIVIMYGFPRSHPRAADNEAMHAQVSTCIARFTSATLWAGDFNESSHTCPLMATFDRFGLWRLNDYTPTTRFRLGGPAQSPAIDPALVNHKMLDWAIRACPRHDMWVSDHYSVSVTWTCSIERYIVWRWPRPMVLEDRSTPPPPWPSDPNSLSEWNHVASRWISSAYACKWENKLSLTSSLSSVTVEKPDPLYRKIRTLQRLLSGCLENPNDGPRLSKLRVLLRESQLSEHLTLFPFACIARVLGSDM